MPQISIIIPAYEAETFISETIASCLSQTLDDIEIIIINDGSTDQTLDIATNEAKRDPRITVLSQTNKGPNAARNLGLVAAKGTWIKFLDADDQMPACALEHLWQLATQSEIPVDVVIGQLRCVQLTETANETAKLNRESQKSKAAISKDYFETWAARTFNETLFLAETIKMTGELNENLIACEEHNLYWRLWVHKPRLTVIYDSEFVVLVKSLHPTSHAIRAGSIRWPLLSLQDIAEHFFLHKIPITPQTKHLLFDELYETAAFAFRSSFESEAKAGFSCWKLAGVAPPSLSPRWHNYLHRSLGPVFAEHLLATVRKSRDLLLRRT